MKSPRVALVTVLLLCLSLPLSGAEEVKSVKDTLLLGRLFSYRDNSGDSLHGRISEVYFRYDLHSLRRNFSLFFVPTMYYIARGRRFHVGEILGKVTFNDRGDYQMKRDVTLTTVPHGRQAMTAVLPYLTPDLYGPTIFGNSILSPFHRDNRHYYRYRVARLGQGKCRVAFRPRLNNTQLVTGYALVNYATGRIERARISGEHDMLCFGVSVDMGGEGRGVDFLPLSCQTDATFKFLGNHIKTRTTAYYDQLHAHHPGDSLPPTTPREVMAAVRPTPLTDEEVAAYDEHFHDDAPADTTAKQSGTLHRLAEKAWDLVGDNLLGSIGVTSGNASVRMSPLLNPLYLSYSHSRGFAYKIRIGMHLGLGDNSQLSLQPTVGYNFKIRQFYYDSPLRYTYNARRNNYVELAWANGNRIANSSVLDVLKDERRDTVDFSALDLDYFDDEMWRLAWNVNVGPRFGFQLGTVYHRRRAVNAFAMEKLGKPTAYKSFAPHVQLRLCPIADGPILTANYERSLRRVLSSNTEYERWEFDGVYKKRLRAMRSYNLRMGGGFYTNRSTDYFVDFDNFHEDYLPGGYDDDWSGDFQLLNSQWYNASSYYVRFNASYESPLLFLSWMPWLGRYVERESLYASALHIEHTRPYYELGYGFTTRYASVGLFVSLLNGEFHEFGAKFTFELFRKW